MHIPLCSLLLLCSLFSTSCGDEDCDAGFTRIGAACVRSVLDSGIERGIESCNGMDDDMDGNVDESDLTAGMACGSDVGVCTIGVWVCEAGELVCDGTMGGEETCDGTDEDCDGTTDEGLLSTFYQDLDGDDYGSSVECMACGASECEGDGPWLVQSGDCDDDCCLLYTSPSPRD